MAALKFAGKTVIVSAAAESAEYTGQSINPALTVMTAEDTLLSVDQFAVEWNGNLTDAGTYTGTVSARDGNVTGSATVTFTITQQRIALPEAADGLVYSGTEQIGVESSDSYTVTGNRATDAGDYTAVATPNSNYCWQDGTTQAREIPWSIAKAEPAADGEIAITYFVNGGAIEVTAGSMNVPGEFSFETAPQANGPATATFTPTDEANYKATTVMVEVTLDEVVALSKVSLH